MPRVIVEGRKVKMEDCNSHCTTVVLAYDAECWIAKDGQWLCHLEEGRLFVPRGTRITYRVLCRRLHVEVNVNAS